MMTLKNKSGRPEKYDFEEWPIGERRFYRLESGTLRDLQNRLITTASKSGGFRSRRCVVLGCVGVEVVREG